MAVCPLLPKGCITVGWADILERDFVRGAYILLLLDAVHISSSERRSYDGIVHEAAYEEDAYESYEAASENDPYEIYHVTLLQHPAETVHTTAFHANI